MKTWLRGKAVGLLAFALIAGLVAGGLGWVSLEALRLDQEQRAARRQAELSRLEAEQSNNLRLALWRLDSRVFTEFAREANRPYQHFTALEVPPTGGSAPGQAAPGVRVFELSLTPNGDSPDWIRGHFLVALAADWKSPQVLWSALVEHLGISNKKLLAAKTNQDRVALWGDLAHNGALQRLLADAHQPDLLLPPSQLADNPAFLLNNYAPAGNNEGNKEAQSAQPQQLQQEQQPIQGKVSRDTALRVNRAMLERGQQQATYGNSMGQMGFPNPGPGGDNNQRQKNEKQVMAIVGPMMPCWLTGGQEERLAVARLVRIGSKPACQVTILDWSTLEELLLEEVRDLFPEAGLVPVQEMEAAHPELAMTGLPVELDAGPLPSPPAETADPSLRIGLSLAWMAALVALTAVGLGGWSLIDLSERRIRFVSAVTHELRTPLTTLRLYLDMLTGGMVREEKQKEEYLHTLNAETDRLNRLVTNVLDFARLENQRPRLEKAPVALGDLLEQVRSTWQGRCQDAEKELVVELPPGDPPILCTDARLVQQILGNLIDNACKYSRHAEDRRIWLRGRQEGQRIVVEVEDRGPGVPGRERRSIFRPFRRGRDADVTAGGVGLGLALAHRWTRMLGGKLSLRSEPNQAGACFRLDLPTTI